MVWMSGNRGKLWRENIKHVDGCQGLIDKLKYHHISCYRASRVTPLFSFSMTSTRPTQ